MEQEFWAEALPYLSFCAGMIMLCVVAPAWDKFSRQRSERIRAAVRAEMGAGDGLEAAKVRQVQSLRTQDRGAR